MERLVSDCCNSVVFVINQNFMQAFENFYTFLFVLIFKVFKVMAFLAFFIFSFSLLNVNFIHNNTILYTNFYTNLVTKELCLTNGLAGINHCVQWENKFTS